VPILFDESVTKMCVSVVTVMAVAPYNQVEMYQGYKPRG
jgi:hypothetical protein